MPTVAEPMSAAATIAIMPVVMIISILFFNIVSAADLSWLEQLFWSKEKKEFYKNDAINGSRFPEIGNYPGRESDLEVAWERQSQINKYRRKNPGIENLPDSWVDKLLKKHD